MIALAGGTWIFLAVILVFVVGVIIALYTRSGSGVDEHPYDHVYGGAPGAKIPSAGSSGSDRTSVTEREVADEWRRQERPPHAPPEERAAERERTQRPEPGEKPPIQPPTNPPL